MSTELEPFSDEISVPDLTEHVVGFRGWNYDMGNGAWKPGENEAICRRNANHKPPVEKCCGFYAYHDCSKFATNGIYGPVFGAVIGWGRVGVTRDGWKAQYAQVVAVSLGPIVFNTPQEEQQHYSLVHQVAGLFEVEVVDFDKLEEHALQFGSPVPDKLKPEKRKVLPSPAKKTVVGASAGAASPTPSSHAPIIEINDQRYIPAETSAPLFLAFLAIVWGIIIALVCFVQTVAGGMAIPGVVGGIIIASAGAWYMRSQNPWV